MTRSTNSGSIISNSTVTGVVAGENATISGPVNQGANIALESKYEELRELLADVATNDAQKRVLAREAEELKGAADAKNEPGFRSKLKGLTDLLESFGSGAKAISAVVAGVSAVAAAAGMALG